MASDESQRSDFCKNLRHLAALNGLKQETLAKELGWTRAVVAKLMSGERPPNDKHKSALVNFFAIDWAEFELDHKAFRARLGGKSASSNLPLLTFRTVREHARRWQATFEKYRGQYVIYYRHRKRGFVIASLLGIDRLTGQGIHATLTNPHRDSTGNISAYEYEGYAYPVREYIYFLLEQRNANYEIMFLILHDANTPGVGVLRGMVSGIGVDEEQSYIAARPLVAVKGKRRIENWRSGIGKDLGYLPESSVGDRVRKHFTREKVMIR